MASERKKCLACRKPVGRQKGGNFVPSRRGLCPNCSQAAYRKVRSGQETWESLAAKGLATKATVNALTAALEV